MTSQAPVYLGIDIGTSALKAVLMDATGVVHGDATVSYQTSHPQPLWSEQDPELWWNACQDAIAALRTAGAPLHAVIAIGIAGQMHGAVLLDAGRQPLRPAILWNDGRSLLACKELERRVPDLRGRTGNLCMPGFTAPKILWLADHEPDTFARLAHVVLPKDFVVLRLTGALTTDMSDASGTCWLDPARRDWDDAMLAACGIGRRHMPQLLEGCDLAGHLRADIANSLGLPAGVPVVAGAGDNAAGAVGVGAVEPGQAFLSLGTSGVIFVAADRHRPLPEQTIHAFCHALPKRWHQMTVTLSAAESLRWLAQITGSSPGDLAQEADHADFRSAPLFLPYLSGERTPHNDPQAVGMFHGLRNQTSRAELAYAVMEGVALSFADGLAALKAAHAAPERLSLIGGGARSAFWRQLITDALGVPTEYRESANAGPAYGAARLACLGTGDVTIETALKAVAPPPPVAASHQPDSNRHQALSERHALYRALYRATRPLHQGTEEQETS
ncbi:MAG: xylulokinase [Sphingomonadales bacterium]